MGKHSAPEGGNTLRLAPRYAQGDYKCNPYAQDGFEDWWEQHVTTPLEAANPVDETPTTTIPLIGSDGYPATGAWESPEFDDWGSSGPPMGSTEVNIWRIFSMIIMCSLAAVLVLYALAAALAVIFLVIVVGSAWLGVTKK